MADKKKKADDATATPITYEVDENGRPIYNYRQSEESKAADKARDDASVFTASDYLTGLANQYNEHMANRPSAWNGGTYGQAVQDALAAIQNRQAFSYDLNGDALYQQYKDQYMTQGRLAMADTIGQAASMTGGYGNSYAATAGNQAYQGYLTKLNDVVPELYSMALNKYNMEGQEMLNKLSAYQSAYNTEYGQYRDSVGDWYNEANRLGADYADAYSREYGEYGDRLGYLTALASELADRDYNGYYNGYMSAVDAYNNGQNIANAQAEAEYRRARDAQNDALEQANLNYKYAALQADRDESLRSDAYKYAALQADTDASLRDDAYKRWYAEQNLGYDYDALYAKALTAAGSTASSAADSPLSTKERGDIITSLMKNGYSKTEAIAAVDEIYGTGNYASTGHQISDISSYYARPEYILDEKKKGKGTGGGVTKSTSRRADSAK